MSGGGGSTTQTVKTNNDPWAGAQPAIYQALQGLMSANQAPPSYYGGPLTVGPTSAENAAWDKTNQYNAGYFGQGGQYGQAVGANNSLLNGGAAGGAANSISGGALSGINDLSNMGQYQLGQLGTAGSLDATGAIRSALSGQPDYTGLQGAIDAANNPIMRDFNNNVIPGLNSKATFLNNSTGGIKSLGTIVPDLGQRLSENALALTSGERNRALAAQQAAAGLVTQGGLQQDSQGLQAQSQFASNKLNLGQLLGSYMGQASGNQQAGIGNAPGLYNLGAQPANAAQQYASWDRNLQQQALSADQAKFNYLRDQPMNQARQFSEAVRPYGQTGGSSTSTQTTGGGSSTFGNLLSLAGGVVGGIYGGPAGAAAGGAAGSAIGGGGGGKGGGSTQPYTSGVGDLSQAPGLWNNLGDTTYLGSNIAANANYGY